MGSAQEGIHFMKVKKIIGMVLNMDLVKAYDHVDWSYLRLVLLQIGLTLEIAN